MVCTAKKGTAKNGTSKNGTTKKGTAKNATNLSDLTFLWKDCHFVGLQPRIYNLLLSLSISVTLRTRVRGKYQYIISLQSVASHRYIMSFRALPGCNKICFRARTSLRTKKLHLKHPAQAKSIVNAKMKQAENK